MPWFLYNILFAIGFTLALPYYLLRMRRRGGYTHNFWQRLGIYDDQTRRRLQDGPRTWVHAVSVGEIYIALDFIEKFKQKHPGAKFVLSTTTSTAHKIARQEIADEDVLLYFPADFPAVSRRVINLIQPQALVLVECELWPNIIRCAKASGARIALINGRVSDSSYRGYKKLKSLVSRILPLFDVICVQGERDKERLIDLGANPATVRVLGSAKYDVAKADPQGRDKAVSLLRRAGIGADREILLGGSTWEGEEGVLLDAYSELRKRRPHLMLVLAPRHVERSRDVVHEIEARDMTYIRRSTLNGVSEDLGSSPDVLFLDTTGELKNFYGAADIIFVGKSLTRTGGQNVIEPAVYGKPVIVGPHMENFPVVINDFLSAKAMVQVADADALKREIDTLAADPAARQALGERAGRVVRDKMGAVQASVELVAGLQNDESHHAE